MLNKNLKTRNIIYKQNGEEKSGKIEFGMLSDSNVLVIFTGIEISRSEKAENYFYALSKIRIQLEIIGIQLLCNGASKDVYPSGLAINMGNGKMAYRLRNGYYPTSDDLVNIFDFERKKYLESTVLEQKDFFDKWNDSRRRSQYFKPKYSIESINSDSQFIFFWGHQVNKDGSITKSCLSQWWLCNFRKEGITYYSAEQWMMAEKARAFLDKERLELILKSKDPKEAKNYGRQVSNFNEDVWKLKRYSIVREGNILKFSQNPELKDFLLSTENSIIVEASPNDKIWGIGMSQKEEGIYNPQNWKGQNLLGFALMEIRDLLRKSQ